MILIDTHSHIYEPEFDADRDDVVRRAVEAGVRRILLPAIDAASDCRMFDLCRRYPDLCRPMMGLHPTSVNDNPEWRRDVERVEAALARGCDVPFCAVGEIGLDLYWDTRFEAEQTEALRMQFDMALRYDLPVAVHTRAAWEQMCAVVEDYAGRGLRGVFHAFAADMQVYRRLRRCGDFLFGIGGVVTYKKSGVADLAREIPLDEIVLETDSPYLTPVPFRGRRNESAYVRYVCEAVAAAKGCDAGEVARATSASAARMFLKQEAI